MSQAPNWATLSSESTNPTLAPQPPAGARLFLETRDELYGTDPGLIHGSSWSHFSLQQLFEGFPLMLLPSGTDGMGKVRLVGLLKALLPAKVDLSVESKPA